MLYTIKTAHSIQLVQKGRTRPWFFPISIIRCLRTVVMPPESNFWMVDILQLLWSDLFFPSGKKNTRQVKIRSQFIFEIGKSFQKINEIDARPPQKRRNLKNVIIYPLCNCDCSDRPINKVVLGTPTNLCWWDEFFSRLVSGEIGTFLTNMADSFLFLHANFK